MDTIGSTSGQTGGSDQAAATESVRDSLDHAHAEHGGPAVEPEPAPESPRQSLERAMAEHETGRHDAAAMDEVFKPFAAAMTERKLSRAGIVKEALALAEQFHRSPRGVSGLDRWYAARAEKIRARQLERWANWRAEQAALLCPRCLCVLEAGSLCGCREPAARPAPEVPRAA
jgi:hypothetical protein